MLVGNPRSNIRFSKGIYCEILCSQVTVCGIWNTTFHQSEPMYREDDPDDWHYLLRILEDGKIEPERLITHRLRLEELGKGLVIMRDKTEDYCKVMG